MNSMENERLWMIADSDSRITGPYSGDEIHEKIRVGEMTWLFFAFHPVQSPKWRPLIELVDFLERASESNLRGRSRELWIVEHSHSSSPLPKERSSGPYDREAVLSLIKSGKISYSDRICRFGHWRWERIGECRDLLGEAAAATTNLSSLEKSKALLEQNFNRVSRSEMPRFMTKKPEFIQVVESRPVEAVGDDLVGRLPWESYELRPVLKSCVWTLAFCAGIFSTRVQAATVLKIVPMKLATASPALILETDASPSEQIEIHLVGRSGEILDHLSFRQQWRIKREPGEVATLNLAPSKLASGTYVVSATVAGATGPISTEQKIFIGRMDETFQASLEEHRKQISARQQRERKALFYSAKKYKDLSRELAERSSAGAAQKASNVSWRSFYKSWKTRLEAAKRVAKALTATQEERAYPEAIDRFREAVSTLERLGVEIDRSHGRQVAGVQESTQRLPASAQSEIPTQEFESLRELAISLAGK